MVVSYIQSSLLAFYNKNQMGQTSHHEQLRCVVARQRRLLWEQPVRVKKFYKTAHPAKAASLLPSMFDKAAVRRSVLSPEQQKSHNATQRLVCGKQEGVTCGLCLL